MLKQRFRLILLLTAVAVGLVVVPASAENLLGDNNVQGQQLPDVGEALPTDVITQDLARTLPQQEDVLNYWTPERMRSATPKALPVADPITGGVLDDVVPSQGGLPGLPGAPALPGAPGLPAAPGVPGAPDLPATPATPADDADDEQEADEPDVAQDTTTTRSASASSWTAGGAIVKNVGKVFLTLNGKDFRCSATVVRSGNRDTLVTAGHCVHDGGQFASNWTFVPGYNNGSEPHGKWTARALKAPSGWISNRDLNQDVGFAVLNEQNGRSVADVVGAQNIAFNAGKGAPIYSFGYPQYAPYDGETLQFCSDTARPDQRKSSSTAQGINCDMTEGSSGGPWVTGMQSSGTATVVSVNSFSYSDSLDVMQGPALGSEAKAAYDAASRS